MDIKSALAIFGLFVLLLTPIFLLTEFKVFLLIVGGIFIYAFLATFPQWVISTIEMKKRWRIEDERQTKD